MKNYLLNATDARGRRETLGRMGASLEHVRNVLEREGYRNIEFIDDELSASLRDEWPEELKPKSQAELRFQAKLRKGLPPSALWFEAIRKNWFFLLVLVAVAAWSYAGRDWVWGSLALAAVVWWTLHVASGLARAEKYSDLLKVYALGEWKQARDITDEMLASSALRKNELIQADLTYRKAVLLSQMGQLEQGLKLVSHLRATPQGANGMHESRVSSIYYVVGRYPEFLREVEAGFEGSGRAQLQQMDLALSHARVGSCARSRELMAGVERRNLSEMHCFLAAAMDGMCLRREGNAVEACVPLSQAHEGLKAFASSAATWPFQGIVAGHFAAALALAGRKAEARQIFDAWPQVVDAWLDVETRSVIRTELAI